MEQSKRLLTVSQSLGDFLSRHKRLTYSLLRKAGAYFTDDMEGRNAEIASMRAYEATRRNYNPRKTTKATSAYFFQLSRKKIQETIQDSASMFQYLPSKYGNIAFISIDGTDQDNPENTLHDVLPADDTTYSSGASESDDIVLYASLSGHVSKETVNFIRLLCESRRTRNNGSNIASICKQLNCTESALYSLAEKAYREITVAGLYPYRVMCSSNGVDRNYVIWATSEESAASMVSGYGSVIDIYRIGEAAE